MQNESPTRPVARRVTLKDIAKELNLSHATVSRALNQVEDSLISEGTRRRVQKMAEEMGYRPNHAGRALVTGRTGLVSLWLWSETVQTSYQAMVSQAMYTAVQARGYQLLVDPVSPASLNLKASRSFDPWNVDGIIVNEAGPAFVAQLGRRARPPIPVVTTGSYHLIDDVDKVILDVTQGAFQAVEHLIASGRKRIAYLNEGAYDRNDPRCVAYRELLTASGLPMEIVPLRQDRAPCRQMFREYVEKFGCPDALYCHTDDIAIAVYRAIYELGYRVPDDVAIIGCNGIEDIEYLEVPLTTIELPITRMCELACEFLERRIEDPTCPQQEVKLAATLRIRPSSGGPSAVSIHQESSRIQPVSM